MKGTHILKSQEQIWLLNNIIPNNQAFNIYNCYLLSGEVNIELLNISLSAVMLRVNPLRMYFDYQNGIVSAFINPESNFILPFRIVEIAHNYLEDKEYRELTEEINYSFDLSVTPLFRITLFSFLNGKKILCFVFHKIIIDTLSARLIENQVVEYYRNLVGKNRNVFELKPDTFQEFVSQYSQWSETEEYSELLKDWIDNFPEANEKVELPEDSNNNPEFNLSGSREIFNIDNSIFKDALKYSLQEHLDIKYLFFAAYGTLLHRLSNQNSIVIGFPLSIVGDNIKVLGSLENILPVRFDFSNSPNFNDLIKQLKENIAFKTNYNKVSYAAIVNKSASKKELSINPFYQTSFSFTQIFSPEIEGLKIKEIFRSRNCSRLDLSFELLQVGMDFFLYVEYNTSRYTKTTIAHWVNIYQSIIKNFITSPLLPSDEIDIITLTDLQQLIKWNDTDKTYENEICIHTKLEQQTLKTPEAIALRWDDKFLTYDELNKHANRLAAFILSVQTETNQIIAVCMDRSPEMIISLYAILKAGKAYLPIDTSAPLERTRSILEDSKPIFVFTKSDYRRYIPEGKYRIVELNNLIDHPLSEQDNNPALNIPSDSLAYIIYTSGSTGDPKGVLIQHFSVLNRLGWMQNQYSIKSSDILIQKTPITFDVSIWELFWWSFAGSSLVLLSPGAEKNPSSLIEAIEKFKVTTIHFVPSMFNAFRVYIDSFNEQTKLKSLSRIFLSGEALPPESVNAFYSMMKNSGVPALVNLYGPTEATVDVSYYNCPQNSNNKIIYIGKPIDNTKLFVVNRKNKIQPVGVPGELVIAGTNLAKGYLNRPELNKEKFINILGLDKSSTLKVYKTGDIARWTSIGEIDYIGRIDNQVKIRGFRIELGEIESKIMEFKGVESCAVVVNKSNQDNPLLIAYLKYSGSGELDISNIKTFLAERVPEYMVPTTIISLPEMPLTSSGKIDRKTLPEPQLNKTIKGVHTFCKVENILLTIWQNVLKNENIDTATNFFDVGGNSIMVPLIAARLNKEYNLKVNTLDIFQYPTIESLSAFLGSKTEISSKAPNLANFKNKGKDPCINLSNNRIAVVGIAGKFPDADTKEEFWGKLCDNRESLHFFNNEVLKKYDSTYERNKNNPNYIKSRGILNNIDLWDAEFFGFSPQDARYTDPQQRLWFETVWNALEDAGCDPYNYKGDISVFAGVNLNSYLFDNILRKRRLYEDYMHFGDAETFNTYINNDPAFTATRTAYLFNLKGLAINVQSACSTSLMAVAQACSSLISGESDISIAGASSVQTPQQIGYIYQADGMRSSDGHCRPFDKNASGTVFSNAIGAVVLKRLEDAIRDNDEIYAVIRGWAVNNDGYDKIGFAAPSINGQFELVRKALHNARVHPEEICYIEAHGTGTILGDPIEVSALTQAFRETTCKKQFCGLGSVKGNIGHTDEAAGIMGFIKVALAAYYRKIPATINYSEPNPNIDLENSPFFIVDKNIDWDGKKSMIMGVSSFGVGGTNVHVIIENYNHESEQFFPQNQKPEIITLSAKSIWSLEHNIDNLVDFYNNNSNILLSDISYTTQLRKVHFQNKAFALVSTDRKLSKTDFIFGSYSKKTKKTVFLFPGQGAQFINMGLALYNCESRFKEISDSGFELYKKETGIDLRAIIFTDSGSNENLLNRTEYSQPALFIISYSVAKLYEQFGIIPEESIGHSIGEYVSACISGVFDFETALKIVTKRGQLMQTVPGGSMMAVRTSFDRLHELNCNAFEIAAINAPQSCTISFKTDMLETIEETLRNNKIEYILLKTSHAFHSSQFDVVLEQFEKYVDQYILNVPSKPFISCSTGDYIDLYEVTKGRYWAHQLRATVQFDKGLQTLQNESDCIFIESGPNTHLSGLTRQNQKTTKNTIIISSIGSEINGNTYETFLESIGYMWIEGLSPDFKKFYPGKFPRLVKIPGYTFKKKRYWIDIDYNKLQKSFDNEDYIINKIEPDPEYNKSNTNRVISLKPTLTNTEKSLLGIWAQTLGINDIELDDNFFDVGGGSLHAITVMSKIKSVFKVDLSLKVFLDNQNILDLSKIIDAAK
jgi:amino acid adenylation domain-containing protein